MAAIEKSFPALIAQLTTSLSSAIEVVPDQILPPEDGISLLDVKNELMLAYLQNLVFLILFKLRNATHNKTHWDSDGQNGTSKDDESVEDEIVRKLVELRVYLERGVRPLEGRLKYQIDKVLRAADDATRHEAQKRNGPSGKPVLRNGTARRGNASPADSDQDSDASEDSASSEDASDSNDDDDDGDDASSPTAPPLDDLAYRPNPASFLQPQHLPPKPITDKNPSTKSTSTTTTPSTRYIPPKITPTALAPPPSKRSSIQPPPRSHTLDAFVAAELSSAPLAEPSIGADAARAATSTASNITGARGQRYISARERDAQAERTAYEEANLVRLPGESRTERVARQGSNTGRGGSRRDAMVFGGEEFFELGEGADRIGRAVREREKGGGGVGGVLGRSRKRGLDEGGGGGDGKGGGARPGELFRRKMKRRKK
ncbi:MAG: hypothetical protein M1822_001205 [Bathelium mastoideum]|nr:MAG: hypothetical protein M1822_001205 [Bathelium mastoideum]